MFRNTLFIKLFLILAVVVGLLVPGVYYFTVPVVNQHIYKLEEHAGKTALDSVTTLFKQSSSDLSAWRAFSLKQHKQKLKDIVTIAANRLAVIREKYKNKTISEKQARREAIALISSFRYSKNDYLYISDYNYKMVYHPDPLLNNKNISKLRDVNGKLIMQPMVDNTRAKGESYYRYKWHRLGKKKISDKLTYSRDLPAWKWVIGSGVYLDDIKNETALRRDEIMADLRHYLRTTKIATNGYMYIFDGNMNMLIHPNDNIEGTNFANLLDPLTGKSIAKELISVARSGKHELAYKWDKPSDPGRYIYDKIAWVNYLPEYDYYIVSSVYKDDLLASGHLLAKQLFITISFVVWILFLSGAFLIYQISEAIKKLAIMAEGIVAGDAQINTKECTRNDEIGQLGHSLNQMISKFNEHIDNLEERVEERTAAQGLLLKQLEQRNRDISILKDANERLQSCRTEEEVFQSIAIIMRRAFPGQYGTALKLISNEQHLEVAACWNSPKNSIGRTYSFDGCFGLRKGASYIYENCERELPCAHTDAFLPQTYLCTPITAYGDTFGILHLEYREDNGRERSDALINLVENISEYIASTLVNLRLRLHLERHSIRDTLTGLYNRRYLDEAQKVEESRARRNNHQVGIIMIDVDHFKHFNDNYGHDAGDEILQKLGEIIRHHFRESDICCRYGGEEFIVLLPAITLAQCLEKAEQLCTVVRRMVQICRMGEYHGITISLGVAVFPDHDSTISAVLKRADEALYLAKSRGRNMVVCSESADATVA